MIRLTPQRNRFLTTWVPGLLFCFLFPLSPLETFSAPSTDTSTVTTLRFVSWKPDHPQVWREAIAQFSRSHPHISIIREIAPHSSTAYHDLLTQKLKNQNSSIDLFFMDVVWIPEFAAAGWARPLNQMFPSDEQAQFLPATIQAGTYQDQLYGIPSRIDGGMLYYRKDLLEQYGFHAPATWKDLVSQAKHILEQEGRAQPALQGYSAQFKQYEGLVCNMLEWIYGNGGHLISSNGSRAQLHHPESLAPLEFLRSQVMGQIASQSLLTYQEPESLAVFIQGHAIFHRNWPYAWTVANNPTVSNIAGKVGVAPIPAFKKGQSTSALGGWLYGISAFSHHQQEAMEFIRYLSSYDSQKFFAIHAGLAPSRTALYQDPHVLAAQPFFRDQFEMFTHAAPRPRSPLYPALSHILQRYFSRALAFPYLDLLTEAKEADRQIDTLLQALSSEPS